VGEQKLRRFRDSDQAVVRQILPLTGAAVSAVSPELVTERLEIMKEDLREVLPLWSLDRRGDGPRGTAATREAVGISSPRFLRSVPLGDAAPRRVPDRITTDPITPLTIIRRILEVMRLRRARARSRQQLKELNNHLRKDIGLGREAIDYTSPRPEMYWD